MADPNTPDVQKLLSSFDPTKIMGEVQNLLQQYKLPGLDMEALAATQKKNIEALTAANRTTVEGLQALARRQTEVLQETMHEASQAVASMAKASGPGDLVAKQTELMRNAFEKGVSTMREMAEIVTKANREASETIKARITATLEEVRGLALKK